LQICLTFDMILAMARLLFKFLAVVFLLLGGLVMFGDITDDKAASVMLGQYLYERAPSSLQIAEAVIDRYIDPCSLIVALGCSPFLWHPLISGLLQWPAAIVFLVIGVLFWLISRLFAGLKGKRHRQYHREGRQP